MSEYAYTTAPINTKALGIGGYKRTIFALHSGGMTIHEIAREFELKPSEVRRVIVDVWATDSSALKAEKEAAEYQKIMVQHFHCEPADTVIYTSWFLPAGEFADDSVLDRAFELGTKF